MEQEQHRREDEDRGAHPGVVFDPNSEVSEFRCLAMNVPEIYCFWCDFECEDSEFIPGSRRALDRPEGDIP